MRCRPCLNEEQSASSDALRLLEAYAAIPIRMAEVGLKQTVELSALN